MRKIHICRDRFRIKIEPCEVSGQTGQKGTKLLLSAHWFSFRSDEEEQAFKIIRLVIFRVMFKLQLNPVKSLRVVGKWSDLDNILLILGMTFGLNKVGTSNGN